MQQDSLQRIIKTPVLFTFKELAEAISILEQMKQTYFDFCSGVHFEQTLLYAIQEKYLNSIIHTLKEVLLLKREFA